MDTTNREQKISERMARSVMKRYAPEQVQWHYEHGLVLQAIWSVAESINDSEMRDWVIMMYDTKIREDGAIISYRDDEFNLDQINPGKALFDLYAATGKEKYRIAIETLRDQLRQHPRTGTGGFWHKKIYPWQMWLDGLYMQGPFYARYAAEFGTREDFADVVNQFVLVEKHARDSATGLMYHAWDESGKQLWANPETGCSPHFWGRAMGWYCMALLDTLLWIPGDSAHDDLTAPLIAIARRLVPAVLSCQDSESGLWFQVLDQPKRERNYLESSASSMFVNFLFRAARAGYADDPGKVLAAAQRGFESLVRSKVEEDADGNLHLSGICSVAGLGGNPYRDGSFEYYVKEAIVTDDFKGVGPFILASLESERI